MLSRRRALVTGAGVTGLGLAGLVGWQAAPSSLQRRVERSLGLLPDPYVPDAPEGEVRVTSVTSAAMGEIGLFTAAPHGHGDGAGLPVVVVLHGSSASATALREFGLGRFVTAAVRAGAPPFVLAGTDDGPAGWVPSGDVDPATMLREELPRWLSARGYDAGRRALWGWSRGGYGALRFVQADPGWASALALFSPALHADVAQDADLSALAAAPWAMWCATDDPFSDGAVALASAAPTRPDPWVQGTGGHTRIYWNRHTVAMLDFLARQL